MNHSNNTHAHDGTVVIPAPAARLACLHVLTCREQKIQSPSGLPYPQRKKAVRAALGI